MYHKVIWKVGDSQISKDIAQGHTPERITNTLYCYLFGMKIESTCSVPHLSFAIIFSMCKWKPYFSESKVLVYVMIHKSLKLKCLSSRQNHVYSLCTSL